MAQLQTSRDLNTSDEFIEEFKLLSSRFAQYCQQNGADVTAYRSESVPLFSALPRHRQQEILVYLRESVEVFTELTTEGISLRDDRKLLWRSLRRLGLTPHSDVFDKIGDSDIVEIYSLDQVGLFRNLKFYEVVSYTLEECMSGTWFELSGRDENATIRLHEIAVKLITGEITQTVDPGVPEHHVWETRSLEKLNFNIKVKYLSPLNRLGQLAALLAINHTKVITI